jgi:thiamine biosynthesis lipoprotein
MRKKSLLTLAILALMAITAIAINANKEPLYHAQSYVFGTLVDISIYGESDAHASALANQVLQDFQQLHHQLHAWKNNLGHQTRQDSASELIRVNTAFSTSHQPVKISPLLTKLLSDAQALSIRSEGLFNPAIGHLISTWGFQQDNFGVSKIDAEQIQALVKANPSMSDISLQNGEVYSKNPLIKLDLGGYAKGYALDLAVQFLRAQQVQHALINIGGNIIAIGQHGSKPWRVGIQHPRQPAAIATLDLHDGWAIGTSGDYQRYFMLDGKRYCHIIDPRTGYPVQHTQAVTVLIPPQPHAGVLSDVASKPIFIETGDKKSHAAELLGITHYMVIDQNANVLITKNMAQKIEWLDEKFKRNAHVKFITP